MRSLWRRPSTIQSLATMEPKQIEKILLAYRERLIDLEKDRRFEQFLILKNYPGIFNRHPHSHILAMPVIPKRIDEEILGTLDYYQRKERCIFCDIIKEEIFDQEEGDFGDGPFFNLLPLCLTLPL